MSIPNTSNDPQAPLLATNRAPNEPADDSQGSKKITIFNKPFSIFQLVPVLVGTLALIAIGISIAAIGTSLDVYCFVLKIVLSVEHQGDHSKSKYKAKEHVCLTPECVQLSADLLRSFGDADPCDDFYEC